VSAHAGRTVPAAAGLRSVPAIKCWAALGALMLAVELFFIGKWVTSDAFTPVKSGPDSPPGWMAAALVVGQVLFVAGALWMLYRCLVVPWRRERRVSTDGLLCIAALLASPWDMFSNYWDYWFTYNSHQVNMGSVMSALPGVSPHAPGQGEAWPILLIPGAYVVVFVGLAMIGCRFMSWCKRRRPSLGAVRLIALCYVATMLLYLVFDGILCMPLGFWAFQGGHVSLMNGDTYYKYPLQEMITAGAVFTIFTCWRYFVNDRGETIAERGLDRVQAGAGTKTVLRGLALVAVVHLGMFATYHIPNGLLAKTRTAWPQDVQKRSYFTNNICAEGTGVPCPGS
jgi:hypothetical protein